MAKVDLLPIETLTCSLKNFERLERSVPALKEQPFFKKAKQQLIQALEELEEESRKIDKYAYYERLNEIATKQLIELKVGDK